jgi:succinate dehydrogenase hydrophobic anchor subunit
MSAVVKWWSRASAAMIGAVLTLAVPVHAWAASNGVADVATEAAKYRRRSSGFGFFGFAAVCCLVVVGAIVLIVFLIVRSRRKKP